MKLWCTFFFYSFLKTKSLCTFLAIAVYKYYFLLNEISSPNLHIAPFNKNNIT